MTPLEIAIVTHTLVRGDGQGRVNLDVAREALDRGHRLLLVATRVDDEVALAPGVTWERVAVDGWPGRLAKNAAFAVRASARLRAHRPDLVMACGFTCVSPTDLNAVHFVHGAWWRSPVHTRHVRPGPYGWYQAVYTAANAGLERAAFARTRAVVAVSDRVAGELTGRVPVGVPVHTIPNGVDVTTFAPGPVDRTALGLPAGPLALFVGGLQTPIKNVDGVLRALAVVPGLHLAVAGEVGASPYPALAERLGIADRVSFLGYRSDVADLLRAADVFVLPSRYESFSLVVLEAMASGTPVVTAATVGAASLVGDGGIVLSDPDDAEGLRQALARLASDAPLRRRMGAAGRARALRHTSGAMADRYVDLLESLVVSRRPSAPVPA